MDFSSFNRKHYADPYPCYWNWDNYFERIPGDINRYKCRTCCRTYNGDLEYYEHLKCANLKPMEYPKPVIALLLNKTYGSKRKSLLQYNEALEDWYLRNTK